MTIPAWRDGLAYQPQTDGWRIVEAFRPPLATKVEGGPDRLRAVDLAPITRMAAKIIYSSADLATFQDMVFTDFGQGVLHFTMQVYKPGTGYESKECYFDCSNGAPYTVDTLGGDWFSVNFTLCILSW